MELTDKQKTLLKSLIRRNANKMVLFMIMSKTDNWSEDDLDTLIDATKNDTLSVTDIVNKYLELSKKYPSDFDEVEKKDILYTKPFLFMFYEGGQAGLMKFEIGTKEADYFNFDFWDFNVCRLPKDINDDEELKVCAEEWVYPNKWITGKYVQLREIDYSKYKAVIVWNDMTPNSLMFLYTICKFVNCDIFENNVSKFDMSPCSSLDEPDRDYDGIYEGLRLITPELRQKFVAIYDKFAGLSPCPKIAQNYDISIVDEDIIENRIMSKVTSNFKAAIRIAIDAESDSQPGKQDFIGYQYYYNKLYDYVTEDRFELKQLKMPDHSDGESEPITYKGVDISYGNCYAIKLKKTTNN